jgi:hypothetical protein
MRQTLVELVFVGPPLEETAVGGRQFRQAVLNLRRWTENVPPNKPDQVALIN